MISWQGQRLSSSIIPSRNHSSAFAAGSPCRHAGTRRHIVAFEVHDVAGELVRLRGGDKREVWEGSDAAPCEISDVETINNPYSVATHSYILRMRHRD